MVKVLKSVFLTILALSLLSTSPALARQDILPKWALPATAYAVETLGPQGPYYMFSEDGKAIRLGAAKKIVKEEDGSFTLIFERKQDGVILQVNIDDLLIPKTRFHEMEHLRRELEIYYG